MENNKYTPNKIALSNIQFSIPLYQRLFEWEEEQIVQLLKDLYSSFDKDKEASYYIGMLTVFKNNGKYDLVDGQQRFTIVMLMAIAFEWCDVLRLKNNSEDLRLTFSARTKDAEYLKAKINDQGANPKYINLKMEKGLKYIENFFIKQEEIEINNIKIFNRQNFIDFIYNKLTFFISYLPLSYQTNDLNKYFEGMNATGRGLENHEILKVDLLRKLSNDKKELYSRIWNAVSEMDKPLVRKRYDEDIIKYDERQNNALKDFCKIDSAVIHCNFFITKNPFQKSDSEGNVISIRDIPESKEAPKVIYHSSGERAILNFPEFLLQVLWLQLTQAERDSYSDFFNVHKLLETFKKFLLSINEDKAGCFFENLLKYRILFDYYIIKLSGDESATSYTLNFKDNDNNSDDSKRFIQFQSMLYVSTSYYLWLSEILIILESCPENEALNSLLTKLIKIDNERHKTDKISLSYNEINRYWFWRLDYYLWEKRKELFKEDYLKVVEKYTFKSNRSIEHLHPQDEEKNSKWVERQIVNSFGNLALISSGFNSTQSNDNVAVKFGRIREQLERKALESIKLLVMFENADKNDTKWTPDLTNTHGINMIQILIDSFPKAGYDDIREKLEKQKIEMAKQ